MTSVGSILKHFLLSLNPSKNRFVLSKLLINEKNSRFLLLIMFWLAKMEDSDWPILIVVQLNKISCVWFL